MQRKPPCYNTLLMAKKCMNANYFLGLDSYRWYFGINRRCQHSIECSRHRKKCTFNVDEETHDNKDASHPGCKTCSIDLDREWSFVL